MNGPDVRHFLRLLVQLRWIAVACQVLTVLIVSGPVHLHLAPLPLWSGIVVLAVFNGFAAWRARSAPAVGPREVFLHLGADIAVLAWLIAWSGGIENPFASLFLLPIALSIWALPQRWAWAVALVATLAYGFAVAFGRPLPHVHGVFGDAFDLHKAGMLVNFLVSATVMLLFFARVASAWRARERELATMRERFARDEGIIALATHAASVAHELNTPLGTLTLLVDGLIEQSSDPAVRRDVGLMRGLIEQCRDRVRALAQPASGSGAGSRVELDAVIDRWRLIRPTVELVRSGWSGEGVLVEAGIGHLLLALLNNAADAGETLGVARVDLHLELGPDRLSGSVRDYGPGFGEFAPKLPGVLFRTDKPGGMGIGLALSHATVERLGGSLSMQGNAAGGGVAVAFQLPVAR